MHKIYLSPLILGFGLTVSLSTHAFNAVSLEKIPFQQLQQLFYLELPQTPHFHSIKNTADKNNRLIFIRQHTDKKNVMHIRLRQDYEGFEVFGGYAIVHKPLQKGIASAGSQAIAMNGLVYSDLVNDLGKPAPQFVKNSAEALDHFKQHYAQHTIVEEQATPIVYANQQRAVWAYKIRLLVQPAHGIPERPTAIIEADTFKVLEQWNEIKTNHSIVNGQGYGGNVRSGLYQYGTDLPYLKITRDNTTGICYMKNKTVRVVDMEHGYETLKSPMAIQCSSELMVNENTWWTGYHSNGFDEQNGAYSPTNDALYIGSVIKDMYRDWYDIDVLTRNDKPMSLVMRVHYGEGYENAFWDGRQMTFGDGDDLMYPLVSLDVGAHEISHGFTEQHSNLHYYGQSGGMNESFSDMAAQAAEVYVKKTPSWSIGRDIMKQSSGYDVLRYMDHPSRDGSSIDTANEYRPGMNVHYSSGVYNRLFYLLANQPDWDVKQAFHAMLKANVDYWTPYSNFEEGACGLLKAAEDLNLPIEGVKKSLDEVVISYRRCFI